MSSRLANRTESSSAAPPYRRSTPSQHQIGWLILISAAYLIKLTFMPITSQNDLLLNAWQSHSINQGHWNVYAYMAKVYEERNIVTDHPPAPYPYGFYAVTAGWLEVLRLVGLISYEGWTTQWAITNQALWFLLLKLPYLAADIVIGVWSQFYWAVWLTPFIVALVVIDKQRYRYWAMLWLILEVAFGVLLFSRHRDFSIGLLASMSLFFRFAQLDAVISLFAPGAKQLVEIVWTVMRTAQTTAWLLSMAGAIGALIFPTLVARRSEQEFAATRLHDLRLLRRLPLANWATVLLIPAIATILSAAIVFTLSRNAAVREFGRVQIGQVTLTASQPMFSQTMAPPQQDATGLLLLVSPSASANLPKAIELCARPLAPASDTLSPTCSQGSLIQTVGFNGYGFVFSPSLAALAHPYVLDFRLITPAPETRVVLTLVSPPDTQTSLYTVRQDSQAQIGLARLILLRTFDAGAALTAMMARLVEDWRLFLIWGLSMAICLVVIGRFVRGSLTGGVVQLLSGAPAQPK